MCNGQLLDVYDRLNGVLVVLPPHNLMNDIHKNAVSIFLESNIFSN